MTEEIKRPAKFPHFPKDADERDACRGAHRFSGCGSASPGGWVCTRGGGHEGDHIASLGTGNGGRIIARWHRAEPKPCACDDAGPCEHHGVNGFDKKDPEASGGEG